MKKILYFLSISIFAGCVNNSETEKSQSERNNIINVHDIVQEIKINDVLINGNPRLCIANNYLIISDYKSPDKMIHMFDKENFKYIASTGYLGQGPGEISRLGYIEPNEIQREFYATDFGKQKIFSYSLDSIIANPSYIPETKTSIKDTEIPAEYTYLNDTLCIGSIIEPIGNSNFQMAMGKWNMSTGKIERMRYEHPEIEKRRMSFALSLENNMYVEVYNYHDLITICDIDGNLKYNIYGPNWDNKKSNRIYYFGNVEFCNDKIIASYSGGDNFTDESHPTKFIVFDLTGNYIKTLDLGRMLDCFCYDKENNRLIMAFDDKIEYGYLDMDGLLE